MTDRCRAKVVIDTWHNDRNHDYIWQIEMPDGAIEARTGYKTEATAWRAANQFAKQHDLKLKEWDHEE